MADGFWSRFRRSVASRLGSDGPFPPPSVPGGDPAAATRVREALAALLAADEDRFRALFLDSRTLPATDAELPHLRVCAEAGLVRILLAGAVRPAVRVFFLGDLFVATDLLSHDGEDQVFSLMLEQVFLVRTIDVRPGDRFLELCLGSGVNAFAAARLGASRITGTDVNPRALAFARFNAALNGIGREGSPPLEALEGSLFQPLAPGDRFDVVLVNPPFELVPPGARWFLHSHGGPDGLDVVRKLLPGLPERLAPGGRFEMYTWTPSTARGDRVADLVAAALPEFRVEVRRVDSYPLEARLETFRDEPGYAAWRDGLVAEGITLVRGVHVRAYRAASPAERGVVVIDARDEVAACDRTLRRWFG